MNRKQRNVLIAVSTAFILTALFPPFHFRSLYGLTFNLGYGWLLSPPHTPDGFAGTVDIAMLLIEWVGIAVVGAVGYQLTRDR